MANLVRAVGKLSAKSSVLFVCDVQERFRQIIYEMPSVIRTSRHLIDVSRILGVPCLATEQYPRAFQHTVPELNIGGGANQDAITVFEKKLFSMWTDQVSAHMRGLRETDGEEAGGRRDVIICGIEAHVCVAQTCLDLLEQGYAVHVVVDGVSSQRPLDRIVALRRLAQVGAYLTTAEAVVFQLMRTADHPNFKEVSQLVKDHGTIPNAFQLRSEL